MDLQQFCSKREGGFHRGIDKPFSKGTWTYATDGVICIRVPRLAEVGNENGPDAGILFDQVKDLTEWQSVPFAPVTESLCEDCGGKGHVRGCKYCYGQGCGHCKDNGQIGCIATHPDAKDCEDCLGTGKIQGGSAIIFGTGCRVRLSAVYLDQIKSLTGVMIALPGTGDPKVAARIKFDGGEGLLMPMRLD